MEALWKKIGGDEKFTAKYFSAEVAEAYSFYFEVIKIWGYLGLPNTNPVENLRME